MSGSKPEEVVECYGCAGGSFERLDLRTVLSHLEPGDILCAASAKAPLIICLVMQIAENLIVTRRVTDGDVFTFDRVTGLEKDAPAQVKIVSVEPLPSDIHDIMLKIDRRCRLQVDRSHFRLGEEEKRALIMLEDHYYAHLI